MRFGRGLSSARRPYPPVPRTARGTTLHYEMGMLGLNLRRLAKAVVWSAFDAMAAGYDFVFGTSFFVERS